MNMNVYNTNDDICGIGWPVPSSNNSCNAIDNENNTLLILIIKVVDNNRI